MNRDSRYRAAPAGPLASRRQALAISVAALAGLVMRRAAAQPAQPIQRAIGFVAVAAGAAELHRKGQVLFVQAGLAVEENDRILTARDARVEIALEDGSRLAIGDLSEVSIAAFAPQAGGSGRALIDLAAGILRVVTRLSGAFGRFEVRTATAIASVRSTDWIVSFEKDTSAVFVRDGRVAVTDPLGQGEVVLRAGYGADVALGARPSRATRWGRPRIEAAERRVGLN